MAKKARRAAYVIGLDEFEGKIRRLAAKLDDQAIDEVLFDAGTIILEDAAGRIDDLTGNLRESGYVATQSKDNYTAGKRRNKKKPAPKRTAIIRFAAKHAHLVEFGTAAHRIKARRRKAMKTTQSQFAHAADHPGATAKPFLRPAYDAKQDDTVRAMAKGLEKKVKGR